jgi:hypothetical protein
MKIKKYTKMADQWDGSAIFVDLRQRIFEERRPGNVAVSVWETLWTETGERCGQWTGNVVDGDRRPGNVAVSGRGTLWTDCGL